jgi:hypothetical protein
VSVAKCMVAGVNKERGGWPSSHLQHLKVARQHLQCKCVVSTRTEKQLPEALLSVPTAPKEAERERMLVELDFKEVNDLILLLLDESEEAAAASEDAIAKRELAKHSSERRRRRRRARAHALPLSC